MDYLEKVRDEEARNSLLYKRMDEDKNLLYLDKFILKNKDRAVPNIRNSTMNDPAVFFANVVSSLGASTEHRVVETDDKNLDTTYIEEFLEAAFGAVGYRRASWGLPQINPFFDEQSCIRGRLGARCLFQIVDGVLEADIAPWDMRYVTYSPGKDGLDWGAFKSWRTRGEIEKEPWYNDKRRVSTLTLKDKDNEVVDVWDTEHNEIWVNGKQGFEQPHTFGYTPVSIQVVPLGSMLGDKDSLSHQGESIFFLIRDLVPELNELASIAKTINFRSVEGALQEATKEGRTTDELAKYDDVTRPGSITATDFPNAYTNMPIQDVMRAYAQLLAVVESRIERGSLSSIDLGIMPGQAPSAIALIQISEGRDQIFLPRLGTRGLENQQLAYMAINQVIQIGGSVELGARGHKRIFNTGKLQGEYDVAFKYYVKDPKVDAARLSVAGVAERYFGRKTVLRDVIQAEDPDGAMSEKRIDEAELVFPIIKQTRIIRDLTESGEDDFVFEAELAAQSMGISIDRLMAGELPELSPRDEQAMPPQPLELGIGGKTSAKKAAELQQTPEGGK